MPPWLREKIEKEVSRSWRPSIKSGFQNPDFFVCYQIASHPDRNGGLFSTFGSSIFGWADDVSFPCKRLLYSSPPSISTASGIKSQHGRIFISSSYWATIVIVAKFADSWFPLYPVTQSEFFRLKLVTYCIHNPLSQSAQVTMSPRCITCFTMDRPTTTVGFRYETWIRLLLSNVDTRQQFCIGNSTCNFALPYVIPLIKRFGL